MGKTYNVGDGNYTITITKKSTQVLAAMKVLRETLDLGLKEAKDITDNVPTTINGLSDYIADSLRKDLEALGYIVKSGVETGNSERKSKSKDNSTDEYLDCIKNAAIDCKKDKPATLLKMLYAGPQFHCVLNGNTFGPVTVNQFAEMARHKIVNGDTLVWKDGMSNWTTASAVA